MPDNFSDQDIMDSIGSIPNSQAIAASSANENPDEAAQAVNLSQSTGTPAPTIFGDLDGFKQRAKSIAAGQIVNGNPQLSQYVQSNPMAAKVSSDDFANLDQLSNSLEKVQSDGIFTAAAKAFQDNYDWEGQKEETAKLYNYYDNPIWHTLFRLGIGPGAWALDTASRATSGAIAGASAGLAQAYENFGGQQAYQKATGVLPTSLFGNAPSGSPESLARDLNVFMQGAMIEPGMLAHAPPELQAVAKAAQKAEPYLRAGKEPPVGTNPLIDQAKKAESDQDLENLKSAYQQAQASTTRERVPDFMRDFAAQHVGEDTIGVTPDVVQQLYGDKVPEADDGLLGFVPNITQEWATSLQTGADLPVPMADMFAHMTPEVFTALQDGIRVRPEGFTKLEEPQAVEPPKEEIQPEQSVEKPLFSTASAIGMTKEQMARYEELVAKQQEEEQAAVLKRTQRAEAVRATPEWQANRTDMQTQVSDEINQQPRFIVDTGIRSGDIPKISSDALTDEQKAGLPRAYYGKDGALPDAIARHAGYDSGDQMVQDLQALHNNRLGVAPDDYLNGLIDRETDRRMEAKYGNFDDNVLQTSKELAVSDTKLDMLHAELEALAGKSGTELPYTKEELKGRAADAVASSLARNISSDKFMASAFRASKATEAALLKEDPAEAFRQRQLQWASLTYAKEAMKFEKVQDGLEKLAKRYKKRDVTSVLPEYKHQIQALLVRLGRGVNRSVQDIQENMRLGGYSDIGDFIQQKSWAPDGYATREFHPMDALMDASYSKKLTDMTVSEYTDTAKMLKALDFNGKDEAKIIRAGNKVDKDETIKEMVDRLQDVFKEKKAASKSAVNRDAKHMGWSFLNLESLFNRLDKDDGKGLFNQTLTRMYTSAGTYERRLLSEVSDMLKGLPEIDSLKKPVANDLWIHPATQIPMDLTRNEVMSMLANAGNESNLAVLAKGYNLDPTVAMRWIENNTSKADWDYMQGVGKVFDHLHELASKMSHEISGDGIDKVPLKQIAGKYGTYDGWYTPLNGDKALEGYARGVKQVRGFDPESPQGYYRSTEPPRAYSKARTGAVYPVDLSMNIIPARMKQMAHDIAFRPTLIQLNSIFRDAKFKQAFRDYYGNAQAEMLEPFLRNIAGSTNYRSAAEQAGEGFMNAFTQNVVSAGIGMNPGTVAKHGLTAFVNSLSQVGIKPWATEFVNMMKADPATGDKNFRMAMNKSDELNGRMRNFYDALKGSGQDLTLPGTKGGFNTIRDVAQYMGQAPVAVSDLLSAVPTWLAEYKGQIAAGEDEGQAINLADRAVRHAHGSSVLTNKPGITRSTNAVARTFSQFYNFFSHMLQKQYELGWRIKDAYGSARESDLASATKALPKIGGMLFSYYIMPAMVEQLVTPYINSQKDSWGTAAVKTMAIGASSSFLYLRDFINAVVNLRDPSSGIMGEGLKGFADPIRDMHDRQAWTPAWAGKFLKHLTIASAYGTGIANVSEAKAGQFAVDYLNGKEHPKNPWDWVKGLRYGTLKHHGG